MAGPGLFPRTLAVHGVQCPEVHAEGSSRSRNKVALPVAMALGRVQAPGVQQSISGAYKHYVSVKTRFLLGEEDRARAAKGREPMFNSLFAEGLSPYIAIGFGFGMAAGALQSLATKGRVHPRTMYTTGLCTVLTSLIPL